MNVHRRAAVALLDRGVAWTAAVAEKREPAAGRSTRPLWTSRSRRKKVTITARNDGKVVHELVLLLKTDADPGKLPKDGDKVDESTSVGEIADVEPGLTRKATFKLAIGKYAMVCALPGHYEGGMYGSLTVE